VPRKQGPRSLSSMRSLAENEAVCGVWNRSHPVGCQVWYHPIIGEPACAKYTTATPASVLSGHTPVVWLNHKSGCVALEALTDEP